MKDFKEPVLIIGAGRVLADLDWQNEKALSEWRSQCASIRASYKQKTSRMVKGDKEYEYTKWYRIKGCSGSLESVGSEEPDWKKLLPPEPKPKEIPAVEYNGHLIMEKKDYEADSKTFREYLAFMLEDCINHIHPLYANPDKALDSVRRGGGAAGRSQASGGTENTLMKKCRNLWDEQDDEDIEED